MNYSQARWRDENNINVMIASTPLTPLQVNYNAQNHAECENEQLDVSHVDVALLAKKKSLLEAPDSNHLQSHCVDHDELCGFF